VAEQHDAAVPFAGPSSHCSPWLGWTLPLPQGWANARSAVAAISAIAKPHAV